ncbi:MAG: hypothetical protein EU544_03120 [Promethearchaeota archaeon]|nr:MAG: hypothetical protein EU544_03120 [Candidatus Lokiarchaeota archaeon]
MQKSDYIYMIVDNIMALGINRPPEFQGDKLNKYLEEFDDKFLKIIAGFDKSFLEHFLIISKGKSPKELEEILKKMEAISYMVGPTGTLNYLGPNQVQYILTKIDSLKINDISEEKISLLGDEQLEKQFGSGQYDQAAALENQLASASFYLMQMGYNQQEIQEKLKDVRQDPSKIDEIFNMPQKEIYNMPPEVSAAQSSGQQEVPPEPENPQELIQSYIEQIEQDHPPERVEKVKDLLDKIADRVRDHMKENYKKVFMQMHPDRLSRAYNILKSTKRKSDKMPLLLEWFFCSHLMENIEFKVEHWQVSSATGHGSAGVYTAGIIFSRYDRIVSDFSEDKLSKVINICRRILRTPSKRAIQKLGQDLVAETGFDEHLYFTD